MNDVRALSGTYEPNQSSTLVSPCFDFSGFGADPTLGFSRIFELEPTDDHVHVELNTDGGTAGSVQEDGFGVDDVSIEP